MLYRKAIFILLLPLIFLSFSSCKDKALNDSMDEISTISNEFEILGEMPSNCDSLITASNPNNSYDYVGRKHNQALTYAAENMTTITTAGDSLFNLIVEYIENEGVSLSYQAHLDTTTQQDFDEFVSLDTNELADGMSISSYRTTYIPSNDTVINDFLSSVHDIFTGSSDEQGTIDDLVSFESEIIADNVTYSSDEKTIMLASLSVLRYSIKYWTEAEMLECHPYHDFVSTTADDDLGDRSVSLRFDPYQLLVDYLVVMDCMRFGGLNAESYDEAVDNCLPSGIYSSARAYDPTFPGY